MFLFTSLGGETKPFCRTHPVHNEDFPDTEPLLQELGRYGNWVEVTEPPARDRRQEQVLLNSEEEEAASVEPEEELTLAHSPRRDVQAVEQRRNHSVGRNMTMFTSSNLRQLL